MAIVAELYTGFDCGICHAIKPKIVEILNTYPSVQFVEVIVSENREYSAQNFVFTVPVLLLKIDDKEHERFTHSFSMLEVERRFQKLISQLEQTS